MDEDEIIKKTVNKIYNRLSRYRKKLFNNGVSEISNRGLEIKLKKDRRLRVVCEFPVIWVKQDNNLDISEILNFSKYNSPSLYRRYHEDLRKMELILEEQKSEFYTQTDYQ